MKGIPFHLVIFLSFVSTILCAQPAYKGLQIGERMPDISMSHYLNAPNKKMKISDFKGKLLILDFWGVKCSNCIAHMPKMDSLQKQFGSKIQFVYVTADNEKKVNEVLAKVKVKKPDVPFFVSDTQLYKLFPHLGDPLHVWITPDGLVYAITEDYNSNETSIASFLDGKNPILPRRWDWGVDDRYPLVSEQNGSLLHLANSYSIWLNGIHHYYLSEGIHILKDKYNRITGLQLLNIQLTRLYGFAFANDLFQVPVNYFTLIKNNRIIFEIKDASILKGPDKDSIKEDWLMKNVFTYELKLPDSTSKTIYDVLKQDISLKLPQYEATIENRKVKCIVLSDLSIADQQKARAKDISLPSTLIYKGNGITVQNLPAASFIANLISAYSYLDVPFVSEIKFEDNLQMHLNAIPTDLDSFNKELNRYGFQIKLEEREIKMLVIRDREYNCYGHDLNPSKG